jgi:hypothetical protein
MVKTKEELIEAVKLKFDGDDSDETISLLEDINDTFDDLASRTESADEWREKYEENDKEWRRRYIERFSGEVKDDPVPDETDEPEEIKTTYEELFEEED